MVEHHSQNETQDILDRNEARQDRNDVRHARSAYGSGFLMVAVALIIAVFIGAYVIMGDNNTNDAAITQPTSQSTVEITPTAPAAENAAPAEPAPESAPAAPAAPANQ